MGGYINLSRRHTLLATVMIIFASCGPNSAAGEEAVPTNEPAHFLTITGATASQLAAFGYASPVLIGGSAKGAVAVLFAPDQAQLPALLQELLVPDIPGCISEGAVRCCDEEKDTVAIFTDAGWLRLGERCDPSPAPPFVEYIEVSQELSLALRECCGIEYDLMVQTKPNGELRQLINVPSQSQGGDSFLPPPMLERSALGGSSIILIQNCPTTQPPTCCGNTPTRCHSSTKKLWLKVGPNTPPKWCQQAMACNCC